MNNNWQMILGLRWGSDGSADLFFFFFVTGPRRIWARSREFSLPSPINFGPDPVRLCPMPSTFGSNPRDLREAGSPLRYVPLRSTSLRSDPTSRKLSGSRQSLGIGPNLTGPVPKSTGSVAKLTGSPKSAGPVTKKKVTEPHQTPSLTPKSRFLKLVGPVRFGRTHFFRHF